MCLICSQYVRVNNKQYLFHIGCNLWDILSSEDFMDNNVPYFVQFC